MFSGFTTGFHFPLMSGGLEELSFTQNSSLDSRVNIHHVRAEVQGRSPPLDESKLSIRE